MEKELKLSPQNILIIKLRKLGDVLNTTPLVRQIRNLYPNAEITFLSEPLGAQVYKKSQHIDKLWILERNSSVLNYLKLLIKVKKSNFDLVIDLYDHNKTALPTLCSRAKNRFGFAKIGKKSFTYNHVARLTDYDKTSVYSALHALKLAKPLGVILSDFELEFPISITDKKEALEFVQFHKFSKKTIAFCTQSERDFAQVNQELFVDIGNYLVEKEFQLYFVYGPGEKNKALGVYDKITNKSACIIDYEMPSVALVKGIFEHCAIYVGNDSGNKHMAVAANICSIGIFFGDNPAVWTPPQKSRHNYLQTENNQNALSDFVNLFESWDFDRKRFIINQ